MKESLSLADSVKNILICFPKKSTGLFNFNIHNPYFCIADGVCMPHARPEDGAIKEGLCILKLNKTVDFLGKQISMFFTLSARDNDSFIF